MNHFEVQEIGTVHNNENGACIKIEEQYIPAMKEMEGFSHIYVIWWFSEFDHKRFREVLEQEQPYKKCAAKMGTFATRSPFRPNPIALSAVEVVDIDYEKGIIQLAYIDANDNTPVLDIKPYTPSMDRIETATVPNWCSHWPKNLEESADFAWEKEFNF